MVDDVG